MLAFSFWQGGLSQAGRDAANRLKGRVVSFPQVRKVLDRLAGSRRKFAVFASRAWAGPGRPGHPRQARNRVAGRALRRGLIVVSLGIVIQVILLAMPGIRESLQVIREVRPSLVIAAVVLQVGANLAFAEMYRQTIRHLGGGLGFKQALNVSMGTFTVSRILPGGAATAGLFMTQGLVRFGVPAAAAAGSALVGGIVRMTALGVNVVLGAGIALVVGELPRNYAFGLIALIGLVVVLGALGIRLVRSRAARNRAFNGVQRVARSFGVKADLDAPRIVFDDALNLIPPMRRLAAPGAVAAAGWLFDAASLWLLFRGFDYPVHAGVVLVGFGIANLINTVPITPGGVGLVEAGLAGAFIGLGVPGSVAVITVLAYRLISHWLPVAAGLPAYFTGIGRGTARPLESGPEVNS